MSRDWRGFWVLLGIVGLGSLAAFAEGESEQGTMLVGMLFNVYDRDGDGKPEEWRRTGIRFFDRNGDGDVDLYRKGDGDFWELGWDENFDGIFDAALECRSTLRLETVTTFPTISSAPGALKRERFRKKVKIPRSEPLWLPYAQIAGLAPGHVPTHDPEKRKAP